MDLFEHDKAIVGMVHLLPLPGSPRYGGSLDEVIETALDDAQKLVAGGIDGLIVENFGDLPYPCGGVSLLTAVAMATVVKAVSAEVKVPLGVNVQFNDFRSELAIAHVCGAKFVRLEAFVDTVVSDGGIVQACAAEGPATGRSSKRPISLYGQMYR